MQLYHIEVRICWRIEHYYGVVGCCTRVSLNDVLGYEYSIKYSCTIDEVAGAAKKDSVARLERLSFSTSTNF
jgi:hypothetical protein